MYKSFMFYAWGSLNKDFVKQRLSAGWGMKRWGWVLNHSMAQNKIKNNYMLQAGKPDLYFIHWNQVQLSGPKGRVSFNWMMDTNTRYIPHVCIWVHTHAYRESFEAHCQQFCEQTAWTSVTTLGSGPGFSHKGVTGKKKAGPQSEGNYYSLDLECFPKAHVLKSWSLWKVDEPWLLADLAV